MPSLFKPIQDAGRSFNDMFKDVEPTNLLSSIGSSVKQHAKDYASTWSLTGQVARETAKAPLRVGGAMVDVGRQAMGQQPLPRMNIPGLGEFATPARNTYDESMQTNDPFQLAASGIRNASSGLLDVAGTVGLASLARTATTKGIPIYRGETAANKGGIHWALDKADAQQFGKVMPRTISPSEIVDDSNPAIQKIVQEGAEQGLDFQQVVKNLWDKGFNVIKNTDPITGKPSLIVNPNFTSKAEFAKDAVGAATLPGSDPVINQVVDGIDKMTGGEDDLSPGFLTAALGTKPWDAEKKKAVRELENRIMNTRDKQARSWLIKNLKLLMKVVR